MLSINQNCDDPTPVEAILVTSNKFGSFSPKSSSDVNKITIGAHNNMTKIDSKIINLIEKSSLDYTPIDNQISSPIS